MKKQTFKVTGMHCTSCEMLIKEELEDNGVKNANASHKNNTLDVEFDETKIDEKKIRSIIEKEGYKVE
jgi:copper chaperone CopZ